MIARIPLRLVRARPLSSSVRSLVFEADGVNVVYRAGQSVNLLVPTARGLVMRRPYSIASAPGAAGDNAFEIAVTRVQGGPTSNALHELQEGAILQAEAPTGGWLARGEDDRQAPTLFVGAGSGLAPLRALLQEELARGEGPPVALLFGCRTEADILWKDELLVWAREVPRFSLAVTLSRPPPTWNGRRGHVQAHVPELVTTLAPEHARVCGLTAMTDAVEESLLAAGVPDEGIRVESYDA